MIHYISLPAQAQNLVQYATTTQNQVMTRTIIAIGFLITAGIAIGFYMVGSHGKLMFRPHMTEDWIIWGIALISIVTSTFLFISRNQVKNK